jgi:hypothetical protein
MRHQGRWMEDRVGEFRSGLYRHWHAPWGVAPAHTAFVTALSGGLIGGRIENPRCFVTLSRSEWRVAERVRGRLCYTACKLAWRRIVGQICCTALYCQNLPFSEVSNFDMIYLQFRSVFAYDQGWGIIPNEVILKKLK